MSYQPQNVTRPGRSLEKPTIFGPLEGNRCVSPLPTNAQTVYSNPISQPQTFLSFPHTPQNAKIARSISPSKYSTPTHSQPTPTSNINKIFAPITPSISSNTVTIQYNKIPSKYRPATPTAYTNYASTSSPYSSSDSPYNSRRIELNNTLIGPYSATASPFYALNNQTLKSNFGDIKTYFGSPQDKADAKLNSHNNIFMTPTSTSTQSKNYVPYTPIKENLPNNKVYYNSKKPIILSNLLANTQSPVADILFNRANYSVETGYTDAKKLQDLNIEAKDNPLLRFSVIKSDFKENPYYYNLDDIPESKRGTLKSLESFNDSSRLSIPSLFQYSICFDHQIDYKALVNKLKACQKKFQDEFFPPNIQSLVGENLSKRLGWQDYIWLRPDEFYGEKYDIFVDGVEPNDIRQGELGDCYFLSALSSLAEWPDRIRKIFVSKEKNVVGCYCVRMCVMGEWREIIVDDFFPCNKKTRKPVFTNSNSNELWVLILEKAWAKLYGSYDIIEAGLSRECLHDLTCAPTTFFLTDDQKEWSTIWKTILKCERKNYAMTCGAGDFFSSLAQSNVNMINSKGIVSSHAYSLLAGYEVQSKKGNVKLVKLRNPWGKTEWNGAWSDDSSEWDEGLRKQLNVLKKEDGIFFMEYHDFLKYFSDIQFCFINDGFEYSHYKTLTNARHAAYFKVKVSAQGKYYFTINQESKRKFATSSMDKYSTATIVLAKLNKITEGWDYEHLEGNQRADREVWVKAKLTTGEYMIYAKVAWNQSTENEFVLSCYGTRKVTFEKVSKQDYPNFLEKTFGSKARNSNKKMNYSREGEANAYSVVELAKDGFIYSYYQNDSCRVLNIEVNYKEFTGLKLRKPFRGRKYELSLNPGQKKIVLVRLLPQQNIRQVFSERVRFTTFEHHKDKALSHTMYNLATTNERISDDKNTGIRNMDSIVRKKGKKERLKKPNSEEFLDIFVYQYPYEDGVFMIYENKTQSWVLNERVEFVGKGLLLLDTKIPGEGRFELLPGMTYKLDFRKIETNFIAKFKYHSEIKSL